jgi:hypothetical protein
MQIGLSVVDELVVCHGVVADDRSFADDCPGDLKNDGVIKNDCLAIINFAS